MRSIRVTRLAVASCLFAVTLTSPVSAQRAKASGNPTRLGAVNVIRGHRSEYSEVSITKNARLRASFFDHSGLRFRGGGRFIGLFLLQQGVEKPAQIFAGKFRMCHSAGCRNGRTWSFMMPFGVEWRDVVTIPAGNYRLYLIADGDPAAVRLTLEGLAGVTKIRPAVTVDTSIGQEVVPQTLNNFFSSGSTYELSSVGAAITSFWNRSSAATADIESDCLYEGEPPVPSQVAYLPGCDLYGAREGGSTSFVVPPGLAGSSGGFFSIYPKLPAGTWSYGGAFLAPQQVDYAAFTSVWVNYD